MAVDEQKAKGTNPCKVGVSLILLITFSIISWIVWIIETNPFFNSTWNWVGGKKVTFIVAPLLFFSWAYICRLLKKLIPSIINLCIFYVFFCIITFLVMAAHVAGPRAMMFVFSPLRILLFKPVSLIFISLVTFVFNLISLKVHEIKLKKQELFILYFSFFCIPIFIFCITCFFSLINANDWISGFSGFNNMDSILWFKSGIIIPVSFIYEGIVLLWKRNIISSS
ncbi:MAG: hypothetical protein K6E22_12300 [Treponema sp.]|nr:hypothetical protein [Treponema sp.]